MASSTARDIAQDPTNQDNTTSNMDPSKAPTPPSAAAPQRAPIPPPPQTKAPWTLSAAVSSPSPPLPITLPNPSSSSSSSTTTTTTTSPLAFLHTLSRLKTTPREGWRRFHLPHPESIADHMYRMSIITFLAPSRLLSLGLNIPHCTKMALVHDMAEALVGDITPMDEVPKEEKQRRERESIGYMTTEGLLKGLQGVDPSAGESIREIWEEYEAGETLEARFVHDVDKMELLLQMVEYERTYLESEGINLEEFLRVMKGVKLEEMKVWCEEIVKEREDWVREVEGRRKKKGEEGREGVVVVVNGI